MIFAHTLEKVLVGKKSQTRRIAKPDEQLRVENGIRRVYRKGNRTMYQVGKSYSIQPGRGKKAVARLIILDIKHEPVSSITEDDALAEGFPSRESFLNAWREIHGNQANLGQEVWVLEFKLEHSSSIIK